MLRSALRSAIAATTIAVSTLLAGCSHQITGTPVTAVGPGPGSDGQCATVEAPLVDIPSVNRGEPRLRIPVPPGWKRNTMMDSRIIRYAIVAQNLATDGFAPNAVVTLESVPGAQDADDVFEENRANLVTMMGAFDLSTEINTTCGLPSETTDYTAPPLGPAPRRPIIMHAVVLNTDRETYLATLTIQTADGDDPAYQRDAQEIIEGFQMLPPPR